MANSANEHVVQQVEACLRAISANDLQRLAEAIAVLDWPDRFAARQLVLQGRNHEGQTTKGWPDAYSDAGDGRVHAIEATRDKQSWAKHLSEDLTKAASPKYKYLASFFFVGGYPSTAPTSKQIDAYRAKFKALGLAPEDVTILVGHDLADRLAGPRYAQIRQTILGLRATPLVLRLLRPGEVWADSLIEFQPDAQDFRDGLVWEHPLVPEVVGDLKRGQAVLVRGHGASGKTTFAQCVAAALAPAPVYYYDFAVQDALTAERIGLLFQDMIDAAGRGSAVVIDNIHLGERDARHLLTHWRTWLEARQVGLLLLGREVSSSTGSPIDTLPPKMLRADHPALRGVVMRLLRKAGLHAPEMSDVVLRDWMRTFGGDMEPGEETADLIAFGAAASRRLNALSEGQFELRAADAVEVVRERYIRPLTPGEQDNLLRLATVYRHEVNLPDHALANPLAGLQHARQGLGLVLRDTVGVDRRSVYRLAHPALGHLILQAVPENQTIAALGSLAREAPATALQLYSRMGDGPDRASLGASLAAVFSTAHWIDASADLHAVIQVLKAGPMNRLVMRTSLHDHLCQSERFEKHYRAERSLRVLNDLHDVLTRHGLTPPMNVVTRITRSEPDHFAQLLISSRIDQVRTFVKSNPEGLKIFASIDAAAWREAQLRRAQPRPSTLISVAKDFERWGRPDLASPPVETIILSPDAEAWDARNDFADLRHLAQAVRMGRHLEDSSIEKFVKTIATANWMDRQFSVLKAGTIAGALMSLANHLAPNLRPDFNHPILAKRIRHRLEQPATRNAKSDGVGIALLGTSVEMGIDPGDLSTVNWKPDTWIERLIAYWSDVTPGVLGTYELQLWLGIRAMTRWREKPLHLPGQASQAFIHRLRQSVARGRNMGEIRDGLMKWLDIVEANGWVTPRWQ